MRQLGYPDQAARAALARRELWLGDAERMVSVAEELASLAKSVQHSTCTELFSDHCVELGSRPDAVEWERPSPKVSPEFPGPSSKGVCMDRRVELFQILEVASIVPGSTFRPDWNRESVSPRVESTDVDGSQAPSEESFIRTPVSILEPGEVATSEGSS